MVVFLMRGQHDGNFVWPCQDSPSEPDKQSHHHSHEIRFTRKDLTFIYSSHVIIVESSSTGFGKRRFISWEKLASHSVAPSTKYLKDDCLYFCVS